MSSNRFRLKVNGRYAKTRTKVPLDASELEAKAKELVFELADIERRLGPADEVFLVTGQQMVEVTIRTELGWLRSLRKLDLNLADAEYRAWLALILE